MTAMILRQTLHRVTQLAMIMGGCFLVYTVLDIPPTATLVGTPLADTILSAYPNISAIIKDILITCLVAGSLTIAAAILHHTAEHHHVSKKVKQFTSKLENSAWRGLLHTLLFIAHLTIDIAIASIVWFLCLPFIIGPYSGFTIPTSSAQPMLMLIGYSGLILIIEAFPWWRQLREHFLAIHKTKTG